MIWARDNGYETYGVIMGAFNSANYKNESQNIFDLAKECGLLILPKERMHCFLEKLTDLYLIKSIDDLAVLLLAKPQYQYDVLAKSEVASGLGLEISTKSVETNELRQRLYEYGKKILELEETNKRQGEKILELEETNKRQGEKILELGETNKRQGEKILELEETNTRQGKTQEHLDKILSSDEYKLGVRIRKIFGRKLFRLGIIRKLLDKRKPEVVLLGKPIPLTPEVIRTLTQEYFDSQFYLQKYPDIAAAGVDPLDHYMQYGWREMRTPNTSHTTEDFLRACNLSAKDVTFNPIYQWIQSGKPPMSPNSKVIRTLTQEYFDSQFYLRKYPDIAAAGVDPLDHYLQYGWREMRTPNTSHTTEDFLRACNLSAKDVTFNPIYQWIQSGKPPIIPMPRGRERALLREQATLYSKPIPHEIWKDFPLIPQDSLFSLLSEAITRRSRRYAVAFSHDDYTKVVGGLELCVAFEQKAFNDVNTCYIQLFPAITTFRIVEDQYHEVFVYGVNIDGNGVGFTRVSDLSAALRKLHSQKADLDSVLIVHAFLGHCLPAITAIKNAIGCNKSFFWVHDYHSICPSFNLLRNGIAFCGAPSTSSISCSMCVHGNERIAQKPAMRSLFESFGFNIIAPSRVALDLWLAKSDLPHKTARVLEHSKFNPTDMVIEGEEGPLKIAFLGYPNHHKGWYVFQDLASFHEADPRYKFYLLGKNDCPVPHITWVKVATSGKDIEAMTRAIETEQIDVIVIWANWPETFCFTAFEALAAGSTIITSTVSGNVAAMVERTSAGFIFANTGELLEVFRSGSIIEKVRQRQKSGIPKGHLTHTLMTVGVLDHAFEGSEK